jgi:Ino eighty subunit 1
MATTAAAREEQDPRTSLQHVLDSDEHEPTPPLTRLSEPAEDPTEDPDAPEDVEMKMEDSNETMIGTPSKADQDAASDTATPQYTSTTTTIRRNANGSVSSVYSGNKIRHLKKEDGVPLWRKDIQYDFLKYVFEDEQPVFHKASDGSYGHSFADIYLDAMAKSSKCSKILKEKLLSDRPAAVNMAMVCLLVNVGRMNTTLNFFPEMRAQLRTYHSIPSLQLQAHQDPNAYKQLQDAPRLKSILKGATEDIEQPSTIEDIKAAPVPRTNPVNLIFVLAQYAPKISEIHFDVPRDFFDLVMKEQLSSRSRATAFLWLMWWYLESDFGLDSALENPFGPGRRSRNSDADDLPLMCPQFEYLTDEQAALENVDTPEEVEFGEEKQRERMAILKGEMQPVYTGPKRAKKAYTQNPVFSVNANLSTDDATSPARELNSPVSGGTKSVFRNKPLKAAPKTEDNSDSDQTRQTSPTASAPRINLLLNPEGGSSSKHFGRGKYPRNKDSPANLRPKGNVDYASLNGDGPSGPTTKRSRPPTSHQLALERFRKERVIYKLDRGLREAREAAERERIRQSAVVRAAKRIANLKDGYDSEEEAHMTAAGRVGAAKQGVTMGGFEQNPSEEMDYGEEPAAVAIAIKRLRRRLGRLERIEKRNRDPRGSKWYHMPPEERSGLTFAGLDEPMMLLDDGDDDWSDSSF